MATQHKGMSPERAKRAARVLKMKDTGHTWDEIAAELGISRTQVRNDYKAAIDAIYSESVVERVGKVERNYLRLIGAWWEPATIDGDHKAADIVMTALKNYRELFGLDKALKLEVTSNAAEDFAALLGSIRGADDNGGSDMPVKPGKDLSDDAAALPDEDE